VKELGCENWRGEGRGEEGEEREHTSFVGAMIAGVAVCVVK